MNFQNMVSNTQVLTLTGHLISIGSMSVNIKFNTIEKFSGLLTVSVILLLLLDSFVFSGQRNVYGVGSFSKSDKPFGVSYDDWVSRFWNKWIAKNAGQATPKQGGCLLVNNNNI